MNIEMFIVLLILYVVASFLFYFILNEKVKLINLILKSKKPNKRSELINDKKEAEKDLIASFLWPFLLLREASNGLKRKK